MRLWLTSREELWVVTRKDSQRWYKLYIYCMSQFYFLRWEGNLIWKIKRNSLVSKYNILDIENFFIIFIFYIIFLFSIQLHNCFHSKLYYYKLIIIRRIFHLLLIKKRKKCFITLFELTTSISFSNYHLKLWVMIKNVYDFYLFNLHSNYKFNSHIHYSTSSAYFTPWI